MKINIYNAPAGSGIGGSEYCAAVLASSLAADHSVAVVHHQPDLTSESVRTIFGLDVEHVEFKYVEPDNRWHSGGRLPWNRYSTARNWKADFSENTDVFIAFTHNVPPFSAAPRAALYVHFPAFCRNRTWPWSMDDRGIRPSIRRKYYEFEWTCRMKSYTQKLSNSQFTSNWMRQWWGVDSAVVYPPVSLSFAVRRKQNAIISVGRLSQQKKQRELIASFSRLRPKLRMDWTYTVVGSVSDVAYYNELSVLAGECGCRIVTSPSRSEVAHFYEHSAIFWHAMGFGVDEKTSPDQLEHFGIVTVEAMAAGCVPVVVNRGGQREIVEHGISGFLWNTREELEEYTLLLTEDLELRSRMADAAKRRASRFSSVKFVEHFASWLAKD